MLYVNNSQLITSLKINNKEAITMKKYNVINSNVPFDMAAQFVGKRPAQKVQRVNGNWNISRTTTGKKRVHEQHESLISRLERGIDNLNSLLRMVLLPVINNSWFNNRKLTVKPTFQLDLQMFARHQNRRNS